MPPLLSGNWPAVQRLAANGISRLTAGDPLFDLKNMRVIIQAAKEAGIEFVAALQFSLSPVHTDELFVDTTKALLEAGADVNSECRDGKSLLLRAMMIGRDRVAHFLIDHGADAAVRLVWFSLTSRKKGEL